MMHTQERHANKTCIRSSRQLCSHHTGPHQQRCNLSELSGCPGTQLNLVFKKSKKKQCINRLQRGADSPDPIEQEVMPLSYKFTLIPATPQLSISLAQTLSLSLSCILFLLHKMHVHTSTLMHWYNTFYEDRIYNTLCGHSKSIIMHL